MYRSVLLPVPGHRTSSRAGLTTVTVRLSNPADRRRAVDEQLLVDSGAIYAVVPRRVLRRIGLMLDPLKRQLLPMRLIARRRRPAQSR